jgi:hypothetical protein
MLIINVLLAKLVARMFAVIKHNKPYSLSCPAHSNSDPETMP